MKQLIKDSIDATLVESTSNKAIKMIELMREANYSTRQIIEEVKQINRIQCKKKRKEAIASMCHALMMVLAYNPEQSWYESLC